MKTIDIEFLDKVKNFDIPVVESHDSISDPKLFIEYTRDLKGVEGFVIAWDSGYRVKLKAEEYVRFHKTKDSLTLEKNVVDLLINDKLDDAKGFMQDEDRKRVEAFENRFWLGIMETVDRYNTLWREICAHKLDRKRFALERMPALKNKDPHAAGIVFGLFDGKITRDLVVDIIRKNCGTSTKIDGVRSLWGGYTWQYSFEGDN